jgi:hypothetical protein
MAPERVFVHAGVVGYQGGESCCRGVALPERAYWSASAGGAQYYSDDYAVLDSGVLHRTPAIIDPKRAQPGATKHPVDTGACARGRPAAGDWFL